MMAGVMKDFFDRTYYPALDRIVGRPYATLICAGSDGENAARQIHRIASGWRSKTDRRTDHRLHLRPDAGRDSSEKTDRRIRPTALRRDRRDVSGGIGLGNLLTTKAKSRLTAISSFGTARDKGTAIALASANDSNLHMEPLERLEPVEPSDRFERFEPLERFELRRSFYEPS